MTVADLLELLEAVDPDYEVRIASQPQWPLQHAIAEVVTDVEAFGDELEDVDRRPLVWIAEGEQRGYLHGAVAAAAWGVRP